MKSRNLFIGIIVLFIGVVALLASLDVIDFSWRIVMRLWPMLLILIGIAVLPIKDWIKALLLLVVLASGIALYQNEAKNHASRYALSNWAGQMYRNWNQPSKSNRKKDKLRDKDKEKNEEVETPFLQEFSEPYDAYQTAKLDINFGAGNLDVMKPCAELAKANIDSDFVKYNFRTEKADDQANIYISGSGTANQLKGKIQNNIEVAMSKYPRWTVNVKTGASSCHLDLSPYKVEQVDVSAGVSDIEIRLGDHDIDANLNLKTGVSDIGIKVPSTMGCKIVSNATLSTKSFIGFEQVEKGLYQTSDFGQTDHSIVINLDCGISNVNIERY